MYEYVEEFFQRTVENSKRAGIFILKAAALFLVVKKILLTESRRDTFTMAKKVPGIKGKRRYYVLDSVALETHACDAPHS